MAKFQLTIQAIESLLDVANKAKQTDDSLSSTIEFELLEDRDSHTGSDKVRFTLKSSFQDANGTFIGHS